MKSGQWMVAIVACGFLVLTTGCVGLEEHRQLRMAHKTLEAEKGHLETELFDARNLNDNFRSKLAAAEDKAKANEKLVANLQAENDRLEEAFAAARRLLEKIADQNVPQDPIVIETELPAELDSALKDFAAQYPESVVYDAKTGIVKFTSDLVFALGSDVVRESAIASLKDLARIMNSSAAAGFDLTIVGHTDDRPISRAETRKKHPTNWHLSVHRAISVADVFQKHAVSATRIGVMGFGEYRPLVSNATEEGRSQNRRVEVYVVPAGSIGGVAAPPLPKTEDASKQVNKPAMDIDDNVK